MNTPKAAPDSKLGILCLLILLALSPAFARQAKHPEKSRKTAVKPAEAVLPAALAPDPTPPTLAEMPAVPAQVTYRDNQLTITAKNSTMGEILRSVQQQTGAVMDFPPNAAERVVGQFGPGPARDVLASLFDGTNFNYVILGSAGDPAGVRRVIVTVKPSGPDFSPAPTPQPAYAGYQPQPEFPTASDDDQSPSEVMAPQPPQDTDSQDQDNDSDDQQNSPPTGIRTPEQLLQELQRQQQLQQQQQQNGARPPNRPQ